MAKTNPNNSIVPKEKMSEVEVGFKIIFLTMSLLTAFLVFMSAVVTLIANWIKM